MGIFNSTPFRKNKWYITTCEVGGAIETIPEGTVLKYQRSAYSIYDELVGFFFVDNSDNYWRWDIPMSLDPKIEAKGKFKKQ